MAPGAYSPREPRPGRFVAGRRQETAADELGRRKGRNPEEEFLETDLSTLKLLQQKLPQAARKATWAGVSTTTESLTLPSCARPPGPTQKVFGKARLQNRCRAWQEGSPTFSNNDDVQGESPQLKSVEIDGENDAGDDRGGAGAVVFASDVWG